MVDRSACSFICACVLSLIFGSFSQNPCRPFEVVTSNLREVVIAKCTIYQEMLNQLPFCDGSIFKSRNCTAVWETFSGAFLHQPECNVSEERYEDYINLTSHPVPADKSLFWENVYPFVHRFSNKGAKYFTLSDTLTGYIGNMLQWCSEPGKGLASPPTKCPSWEPTPSCPQSSQRAFWIAASRDFGSKASGEIHIMLDAENDPIFANTTYLAEYELPYLTARVKKATVLLLNKHPVKHRSKCADHSLDVLTQLLKSKGIQYHCVENRRDMADLYCLDNPQSEVCTSPTGQSSGASNVAHSIILAGVMLTYLKHLFN